MAKKKVNTKKDLSKYIPSDYEQPLGIEYSKKEIQGKKSNQDSYDEVHGAFYKMTHNNTIPWRNYLIYCVLLTLLTCAFTFSKYSSQLTSKDTGTVAGFGYTINYQTGTGLNDDIKISNTSLSSTPSVDFSDVDVKNYKFKIHNSGAVTVKVTASKTLSGTAPSVGDFNVTFPNNNVTINAGSDGYITMKIDASSVTKTAERSLNLTFNIVQVD